MTCSRTTFKEDLHIPRCGLSQILFPITVSIFLPCSLSLLAPEAKIFILSFIHTFPLTIYVSNTLPRSPKPVHRLCQAFFIQLLLPRLSWFNMVTMVAAHRLHFSLDLSSAFSKLHVAPKFHFSSLLAALAMSAEN